jgi:hypothetical protein
MKAAIRILFVALFGIAMSFAGVIDNFSVVQGGVTDSVVDSIAVSNTLGNRTIWANMTGGNTQVQTQINGGFYYGSVGPDAIGDTGVIYDGMWNLTSPNATALTIDVINVENYVSGAITFFVTQGANTATYSMTVPTIGQIMIDLTSFAGIGSVDRSIIDKVGFTFNHVVAQDIALDNFGTHVVPEPGTYALMAAGLLGLALVRRRLA